MKREDCAIGLKVYTEDGPLYTYKVTSLPDESGVVEVEPTDKSYGRMDSFHLDEIFVYDEEKLKDHAVKMQEKIDEATSAFEKAFAILSSLNEMDGGNNGTPSRYDLQSLKLISMKALERTIDNAGWSSSSLRC